MPVPRQKYQEPKRDTINESTRHNFDQTGQAINILLETKIPAKVALCHNNASVAYVCAKDAK